MTFRFPPCRIAQEERNTGEIIDAALHEGFVRVTKRGIRLLSYWSAAKLLVAEADAKTARGAHQGAVEINLLRRRSRFRDRYVDHPTILPCHHAVELAFGNEVDGVDAESGGDHA